MGKNTCIRWSALFTGVCMLSFLFGCSGSKTSVSKSDSRYSAKVSVNQSESSDNTDSTVMSEVGSNT